MLQFTDSWFRTAIEWGLVTLVFAWAATFLRRVFITNTVAFSRQIDADEGFQMNLEFTVFDTERSRKRKLARAYVLGEARRKQRWEEFQKINAEAIKANQEKKGLKPTG